MCEKCQSYRDHHWACEEASASYRLEVIRYYAALHVQEVELIERLKKKRVRRKIYIKGG